MIRSLDLSTECRGPLQSQDTQRTEIRCEGPWFQALTVAFQVSGLGLGLLGLRGFGFRGLGV